MFLIGFVLVWFRWFCYAVVLGFAYLFDNGVGILLGLYLLFSSLGCDLCCGFGLFIVLVGLRVAGVVLWLRFVCWYVYYLRAGCLCYLWLLVCAVGLFVFS